MSDWSSSNSDEGDIPIRHFAPRRKGFHWTPEGHYGCLVDFLSTTPNSMIFKITTGTCVLKTNFYTHKKKSHVPALILKFFTTTPNLTSNFETSFLAIFGPKYHFETKIVSMKPYWNQQKTRNGFWNHLWFQWNQLWFQWNHMNLTLGAVIVKIKNRNYVF